MTPRSHHLTTLGAALLTRTIEDATAEVILKPGKPLALFIYIAAAPNRSASREHLIDLLWADVEPVRGLRTLRQTVWQMRQTLGEDALVSDGRDISLQLPFSWDRDEFLTAVTQRRYDDAVRIYTGQFLPDFGVPGGAELEHWADRERDRLLAGYILSAEALIRSQLDSARYESAIVQARRLRDSDPSREPSWRLLLEALASSGDRFSTLSEAEDLERYLTAEDREPERLTVSALKRAKKVNLPVSTTDAPSEHLIADLTGRDREFSRLTSAWTTVKAGRFRHLHVSAPPGFGKTRLLRDVFTRLRASGARAVWASALSGDRRLSYALTSDLAGKLGVLSGASGVSTAAASALVALNPTLSSGFAATPDQAIGEEALRHRVHSMTELIEAIAEEAAFALFIDDMHWSDPVSLQLLKSAFSRIGSSRLLLVTSARAVPDGALHLTSTETLTLEALTRDQARELVSGFGSLPASHWVEPFLDSMHEHAGGSPLQILGNLHLALERGLLRLKDSSWECADESELLDGISRGDVLEQRLNKLDPRLFQALLLLAIAEEPVALAIISSALARDLRSLEADLLILELHALASDTGDKWRCAHDTITESVVNMVNDEERVAMHAAVGTALMRPADADPGQLRIAFRHFILGNCRREAEQTFRRGLLLARAAGDRRSHLQLASAMLGEAEPTPEAKWLVSSLPLVQRTGLNHPARIAGLSATLLAAVVIPMQLMPAKPSQLAVTTQPIASNSMALVPSPVIEIQDADGRRVDGASDSITVDAAVDGGVEGTLTVAAVDGRAVFKDLAIKDTSGTVLRFSAKGLKPVVSKKINGRESPGKLRLISAVINGQSISPSRQRVVAVPGEPISGVLQLEYSSYWPSASVILGATAMWGDRRTNFLDLAPLATPAEHQPRRTRIQFISPRVPGIYHIVVAFDAEGNVEDFISGTNWTIPEPVWNDGNDIADWSPQQLAHANRFGWVRTTLTKIDSETKQRVVKPHIVSATVIEVVVR